VGKSFSSSCGVWVIFDHIKAKFEPVEIMVDVHRLCPQALTTAATSYFRKSPNYTFAHRIVGFLDFFNRPVFLGVETRRSRNWICFRPQVRRGRGRQDI
jgi:hypothetical protein